MTVKSDLGPYQPGEFIMRLSSCRCAPVSTVVVVYGALERIVSS